MSRHTELIQDETLVRSFCSSTTILLFISFTVRVTMSSCGHIEEKVPAATVDQVGITGFPAIVCVRASCRGDSEVAAVTDLLRQTCPQFYKKFLNTAPENKRKN